MSCYNNWFKFAGIRLVWPAAFSRRPVKYCMSTSTANREPENYTTKIMAEFPKFNAKVLPITWLQPKYLWSQIYIYYTGPINGVTYLFAIHAFSKWPEIFPVVPPSTTKTLQILINFLQERPTWYDCFRQRVPVYLEPISRFLSAASCHTLLLSSLSPAV